MRRHHLKSSKFWEGYRLYIRFFSVFNFFLNSELINKQKQYLTEVLYQIAKEIIKTFMYFP